MLGIWDVVCEKNDKNNRKRADDLLNRAKCISGRKTSMISLNANFIISNEQELIECSMSSGDLILKVPERISDDLEIKRWKNIVKHVYKGLVDFQNRNGTIGNAYKTGSYDDHAHLGADLARKILGKLELTTPEETDIICSAIYHHDDKAAIDSPMDELLKDADVIDHCFKDASKPVKEKEQKRYDALCKELGL